MLFLGYTFHFFLDDVVPNLVELGGLYSLRFLRALFTPQEVAIIYK
jgi:hypothetical protein